jgi:hypothetical protein
MNYVGSMGFELLWFSERVTLYSMLGLSGLLVVYLVHIGNSCVCEQDYWEPLNM